MKKTHVKVLICNSCYYRLHCNDIRCGEDLCLLYKKDSEIELNMDKNLNTMDLNINVQDVFEIKNSYTNLLHKEMWCKRLKDAFAAL
jgi:hypothetical protein